MNTRDQNRHEWKGTVRRRLIAFVKLWAALSAVSGMSTAQSTWFVDDDAPAGGDGTSWGQSFRHLQDAMVASSAGDEIRVAGGLYFPDLGGGQTPGSRTASVRLKEGLRLRGGFAGPSATDPDIQDPMLYPTVLSGDLNGDDQPDFLGRADNSRHLVKAVALSQRTLLEGFTLKAGNADLPGSIDNRDRSGAALQALGCALLVKECIFEDNQARQGGGAFYADTPGPGQLGPLFESCTFRGNLCDRFGGAASTLNSPAVFMGCSFENNDADSGGAFGLQEGTATLGLSLFTGNRSLLGGAAYCAGTADLLTIRDCDFTANVAWSGGGVFSTVPVQIAGSRFEANVAEFDPGAGEGGALNVRAAEVRDCLFFQNEAEAEGGGILSTGELTVVNSGFYGTVGAAIHKTNRVGDTYIATSTFGGNQGTGILFRGGSIVSCLFVANTDSGVITESIGGSVRIANSTFFGNLPFSRAQGGIAVGNSPNPLQVSNCILWANGGSESVQVGGGLFDLESCCVQGWTGILGGLGNFGDFPEFVDPLGFDGVLGTEDDDLALLPSSPCLDRGRVFLLGPDLGDVDQDGDTTELLPLDLKGGRRRVDLPLVPNHGLGPSASLDIGAVEFQLERNDNRTNRDLPIEDAEL